VLRTSIVADEPSLTQRATAAEAAVLAAMPEGAEPNLGALERALADALEVARRLRVQLDLDAGVELAQLQSTEALFRAVVGVQSVLGGAEVDDTVEALTSGRRKSSELERLGALRAHAFVVARALLDTLDVGYRVAFDIAFGGVAEPPPRSK
jgi:hypothetical protein